MSRAKIALLAVAAVTLALPALAQTPALNMAVGEKQLTSEEIEKQKEVDRAYKDAIKKLPDQQRSNDPWGNIRSVDQSAPKPAASKPAAAKPGAKKADIRTQAVR